MTDVVERLRRLVPSDPSGASIDAIAEIQRLRAALEEAIEFVDQAEMALTPRGEAYVARWHAALATQPVEEDRT